MSYKIRTPMNAVLGYTELLGSTVIDQTQKDYINSIKSSGRSLLTLINGILDLSKIEAGKLELEYDYVDTSSFFSEFEKIFSFKITEKGLKFVLDVSSGTPQGLYIDEARVRQIVFILIGNAIKFTSIGTITLKVLTENPRIVNCLKGKTEELIDLVIEVDDGVTELYVELMNLLPYKSIKEAEPDTSQSESALTGEITDLSGLINSLETDLYTTRKTFSVRQPIRGIHDFGKSLDQLGIVHSSSIITGYGKDLINAVEGFNIETILKLIGEYPIIIKNLKTSTNN